MSNVITFTPRSRPAEPTAAPLAGIDLRVHLEEAAQTALDAADRIIAAPDQIDGGKAILLREPPAPVEPVPAPMPSDIPQAEPEASEAPELVPEEIAGPEPILLPWHGTGNVVSAAGCAFLALVAGA